ncbi:NUMOD4 motif-containing HNH endonuclease [Streptomyces globisporus]|uniref:NUMOD4 motif-containing HNH endonuclease n=1 Tax=Streptomyces globisporus TaxID=1908 RepID=UPI00368B0786
MAQAEEWRDIAGTEGVYQVSSLGNVRSWTSVMKGKRLKPIRNGAPGKWRLAVKITNGEKRKVHALVAEAFIGPRPEGLVVCHNDGNHLNNRADNLRYDTISANVRDSVEHGTHNETRKTQCRAGHPYDEVNTYTRPDGRRLCRACHRERTRDRRGAPRV